MKLRIILCMIMRLVFKMGNYSKRSRAMLLLVAASFLFLAASAVAADGVVAIRFADHHFTPQTLTVPAGQPLAIKVVNASNETIVACQNPHTIASETTTNRNRNPTGAEPK